MTGIAIALGFGAAGVLMAAAGVIIQYRKTYGH